MSVFPDDDFGRYARERFGDAYVAWLTTVGADGTPQPNPVWFLWDGDASLLTYNSPRSNRLTHMAARPNVSVHLDGNGRGGAIVVAAGVATRDDSAPPPHQNPDYVAKYGPGMVEVSGSAETFSEEWGVPVRITLRRVRGER